MDDISKEELATCIDHTNLYADATLEDIEQLCNEAKEYGFGAVCIYSNDVEYAVEKLEDTDVNICSVAGFPHGRSPDTVKAAEAAHATMQGADEIDIVINQEYIKDNRYQAAVNDLKSIREAIDDVNPNTELKVIAENCNLTKDEKVMAYKAADEADADFIKTSTGFGDYGAREEDIELMAETIDELDSDMGIKASGGIGSREDAEKMFEAANMPLDPNYFRIGASGSMEIISNF